MDLLSRSTSLTPSFSSIKPSLGSPKSSPVSSWSPKSSIEFRNPVSRSSRFANGFTPIMASQSDQMSRMAEADPMGMLLRERIVFLGGEISDFAADAIISQLLLLDAKNPNKDIRLFINSFGGSLSATMAIYDVVQLVRADVSTVALGIAASTAALILGGGTKGKRFAMPNARIMIHQPSGGISGTAKRVEIIAQELLSNKESIKKIISEFSGRSLEQVHKDIDKDYYMSPVEGVEYGIVDGVIDRDSIVPIPSLPKVTSTRGKQYDLDRQMFYQPDVPDDEIY